MAKAEPGGQEPLPPRPWRSEAERRVEERLQEIHEWVVGTPVKEGKR